MQPADPRLSDTVFVVFSDDWGRHPSSCQHLFRRVLPHARVLWVNTVGLRTPRLSLYDLKRGMQVIAGWLRPPESNPRGAKMSHDSSAESTPHGSRGASAAGSPNPVVINPRMWPSFRRRWSAALNQKLLMRAVRRALADLPPRKNIVLVSTLPIVPGLFADKLFRKKVYYCVDDFTQWHGVDGSAMRRLEQETLARCDALVATSSPILESRGRHVAEATLLTHGVDAAHFASGKVRPGNPLAGLGKPVLGMFGVFDQRVDAVLLRDLCRAFPGGSVAAIGPVDRDMSAFADLPNLRLFGKAAYGDLPDLVAAFDVCILPYVVDETTRNINPLKLREYLATGKPVVATPLPEVAKLAEYLTVADGPRFAEAVADILRNPVPAPAGLESFLKEESWDRKAEQFFSFVLEGL